MTDDFSSTRAADGRFGPGNPGGPGRPSNASRRYADFDEIALKAHESIVKMVIEKAQAGDLKATALLWSRLMPGQRRRPVAVDARPIGSSQDARQASSAITQAVLDGNIAPDDAEKVLKIIERERRARSTDEGDAEWERGLPSLRAEFEAAYAAQEEESEKIEE